MPIPNITLLCQNLQESQFDRKLPFLRLLMFANLKFQKFLKDFVSCTIAFFHAKYHELHKGFCYFRATTGKNAHMQVVRALTQSTVIGQLFHQP